MINGYGGNRANIFFGGKKGTHCFFNEISHPVKFSATIKIIFSKKEVNLFHCHYPIRQFIIHSASTASSMFRHILMPLVVPLPAAAVFPIFFTIFVLLATLLLLLLFALVMRRCRRKKKMGGGDFITGTDGRQQLQLCHQRRFAIFPLRESVGKTKGSKQINLLAKSPYCTIL